MIMESWIIQQNVQRKLAAHLRKIKQNRIGKCFLTQAPQKMSAGKGSRRRYAWPLLLLLKSWWCIQHREWTCVCQGEGEMVEGHIKSFGLADASCYNRVDKEQSPVAWHRQLYPSSWGKAQWKRTQKRMYIHAQPNQLAVQQESTEHLYINCSSI